MDWASGHEEMADLLRSLLKAATDAAPQIVQRLRALAAPSETEVVQPMAVVPEQV